VTEVGVVEVGVHGAGAARAGTARRAWSTRYGAATLSGRGARVYTCTCVHDNIPCIHVYRSRPIGASLLTTSPRLQCC